MRALLLALFLAAAAPERFTVQVASTSSREEAQRLVTTLVGRDVPAYWSEATVSGKTVYRVRAGSFPTRDAARAFAESLPGDLGLQFWVAPEEPRGTPSKATPAATAAPKAKATSAPPKDESATAHLAAARLAHGGAAGGFTVLEGAKAIELRYRVKSLDAKTGEPVFTRHVYRRLGKEQLRLDITPIEGPAAASTSVVANDAAWVETDGKRGTIAVSTARSQIEALGPAGMLRLPLAFPLKGAAAAGIERATLVGERTLNGEPALRIDAAPAPAPYKEASLYLDPATKRLRAARFLTDAGELLLEFSDYKEVASGLLVPMRRTVWRDGAIVSSVEIDELRLDPDLDASLFTR